MEDLREAKQFEHQCKTLQIINASLEEENARLQDSLNDKIEREVAEELAKDDGIDEKETLNTQVQDLQQQLDAKKKTEREQKTKASQQQSKLKEELDKAQTEALNFKNEARAASKERDGLQE